MKNEKMEEASVSTGLVAGRPGRQYVKNVDLVCQGKYRDGI